MLSYLHTMSSLITITAPGDVLGAITAISGAIQSGMEAVKALAQDQSPEGRKVVADLIQLNSIPMALLTKFNQLLHIDPNTSN